MLSTAQTWSAAHEKGLKAFERETQRNQLSGCIDKREATSATAGWMCVEPHRLAYELDVALGEATAERAAVQRFERCARSLDGLHVSVQTIWAGMGIRPDRLAGVADIAKAVSTAIKQPRAVSGADLEHALRILLLVRPHGALPAGARVTVREGKVEGVDTLAVQHAMDGAERLLAETDPEQGFTDVERRVREVDSKAAAGRAEVDGILLAMSIADSGSKKYVRLRSLVRRQGYVGLDEEQTRYVLSSALGVKVGSRIVQEASIREMALAVASRFETTVLARTEARKAFLNRRARAVHEAAAHAEDLGKRRLVSQEHVKSARVVVRLFEKGRWQATLPLAVADGGAARRLKQAQALDRAVLTVPAGCLRFDHAEEMFKEYADGVRAHGGGPGGSARSEHAQRLYAASLIQHAIRARFHRRFQWVMNYLREPHHLALLWQRVQPLSMREEAITRQRHGITDRFDEDPAGAALRSWDLVTPTCSGLRCLHEPWHVHASAEPPGAAREASAADVSVASVAALLNEFFDMPHSCAPVAAGLAAIENLMRAEMAARPDHSPVASGGGFLETGPLTFKDFSAWWVDFLELQHLTTAQIMLLMKQSRIMHGVELRGALRAYKHLRTARDRPVVVPPDEQRIPALAALYAMNRDAIESVLK